MSQRLDATASAPQTATPGDDTAATTAPATIRQHAPDLNATFLRCLGAGKDRLHLFRIAAGSADETRTHLRVAEAWGYVSMTDVDRALGLLDRELAILFRLTR